MLLQISTFASLFFISLFISIFATGILELRWSGVSIEEWWRNEQFWVIGGVSAHLFAVIQGLLKVLAGIDTNFTVTSKAGADEADGRWVREGCVGGAAVRAAGKVRTAAEWQQVQRPPILE